MNLSGIISISGKPGLYKVVAQGKNNIIVESLEDKKRVPAYSTDRISALDDISVYTYDEDIALKELLKRIYLKENGNLCISHKEDKTKLEKYLLEVLPNYDQERVYISDVKKIFQWYNLLQKSGELKLEEQENTELETVEEGDVQVQEKVKAVKKTSAKSKASDLNQNADQVVTKTSNSKKTVATKTSTSRGK